MIEGLLRHEPGPSGRGRGEDPPLSLLQRKPETIPSAASIYSQVPFDQDTSFLIIGERANANRSGLQGSAATTSMGACRSARIRSRRAHLVDLCVDYVGRDGVADMLKLAALLRRDVAAPVCSTRPSPRSWRPVWSASAAQLAQQRKSRGRRGARLTSRPGLRAGSQTRGRSHLLLIDEEGQARTLEWSCGSRIHRPRRRSLWLAF